MSIEKIEIYTDFIKLEQLIKLSGFCVTWGEAKNIILQNFVFVNNQPCNMRGKKLYNDDVVEIKEGKFTKKYQVTKKNQAV